MRRADAELVKDLVSPRAECRVWEWCRDNVDFRRAPNYDTGYKEPFDPDLMPFWKEPSEMVFSALVREVYVDKCSRAGGSEHLFLNPMRFKVAERPESAMYVTDGIEDAEDFLKDRVIRGFKTVPACWRMYQQANKSTEHKLRFPSMDLAVSWCNAKRTYKQDGWPFIFGDEVSTWKSFAIDQLRKRADMYPFYHLVLISSPDPTRKGNPENDPILVMYRDSDQRRWYMPDPGKKGKVFTFGFGGQDTEHGIKWPASAKHGDEWDLDEVRSKAYYVTEHGTKITNDHREDLMRAGAWQATAPAKRGDTVGYKIVAPMIPTHSGDFGELAARFLAAKLHLNADGTKEERKHNAIRVYFAEYWAEAHREKELSVIDDTLKHREADYARKEINVPKGCSHGVLFTADVQKYHLWWLARVWSVSDKTGDVSSSLLDHGNVAGFVDLDDRIKSVEAGGVGIDIGYQGRASEVMDYCAEFTDQTGKAARALQTAVYALRGSDVMTKAVTDIQIRDAFEGRKGSGDARYVEILWNVDVFRTWLIQMMEGERVPWWVYQNIGAHKDGQEYLKQVTSTKKIDGVWVPPKHGQDHYWDCECMQLVLARCDKLIR